jgi:hypothetical protein
MTVWLPEAGRGAGCRSVRTFHEDGATPDPLKCIFVFGSNLAGRHGAGAAREARLRYGAVYGMGKGQFNRSYALPTKDENLKSLPIAAIRREVADFIEHAKHMDQELFVVTRVGCGLAGYADAEIAPMFRHAPANCSFAEQWRRYLDSEAPWEAHRQESEGASMRKVHSCQSCGFVSTIGEEFGRVQGVKVCLDCKDDYGKDANVTRWVDEKVAAAAKAAVATAKQQ